MIVNQELLDRLRRFVQRRRDLGAHFRFELEGGRGTLDAFLLHLDLVQMLGLSPDNHEVSWLRSIQEWYCSQEGLYFEKDPVYASNHPKVHEMAGLYLSFEVASVLTAFNSFGPEIAHLRELISSVSPKEILERMPWIESPWGSGGWVDSLSTIALHNRHWNEEENREFLNGMRAELTSRQDAGSGLWGSPRFQGVSGQINGAYHLCRVLFAKDGATIPRPLAVMKSIHQSLRSDAWFFPDKWHACFDLDHFKLLSWTADNLHAYSGHKELLEIAEARGQIIRASLNDDEGFSFFGNYSAKFHNYLEVGSGSKGVSDIQGTVFYLEVLSSIDKILGNPIATSPSITHG